MSAIAELRPLGTLAPSPGGAQWSAEQLDRSAQMPQDLRSLVTNYLTQCPVFLAWMGYARDEIGDRFGVSGGAAIASDGVYYWRLDALEYIKEYGIPIPREAVRHFEAQSWRPPELSRRDYIAIYEELAQLLEVGL